MTFNDQNPGYMCTKIMEFQEPLIALSAPYSKEEAVFKHRVGAEV